MVEAKQSQLKALRGCTCGRPHDLGSEHFCCSSNCFGSALPRFAVPPTLPDVHFGCAHFGCAFLAGASGAHFGCSFQLGSEGVASKWLDQTLDSTRPARPTPLTGRPDWRRSLNITTVDLARVFRTDAPGETEPGVPKPAWAPEKKSIGVSFVF